LLNEAAFAFSLTLQRSWPGLGGCGYRILAGGEQQGGTPCDDLWKPELNADWMIVATMNTMRRDGGPRQSVDGYRSGAPSVGVGDCASRPREIEGSSVRLFTSSDSSRTTPAFPSPIVVPVCAAIEIRRPLRTCSRAMQWVTEIRDFKSDARRGRCISLGAWEAVTRPCNISTTVAARTPHNHFTGLTIILSCAGCLTSS
jgi:hypothetical protein